MSAKRKNEATTKRVETWTLPLGATLGSAVRAKGILLEVRARLPWATRKLLVVEAGVVALRMPEGADDEVIQTASAIVSEALRCIKDLPVIPREAEDVLTITSAERHRWLKDGRLPSAGTRTVKLRGRAREITFHVFDPRHIEDVLNRDLVTVWREVDAMAAAENRRRAASKAATTRLERRDRDARSRASDSDPEKISRKKLDSWEEFKNDGPLR